jgi:hypothetical protein
MYPNHLSIQTVVNRKRKPLGQAAVIGVGHRVHSSIYKKGIDIREQAIQEVGAQSRFLAFVEAEAIGVSLPEPHPGF